MVYMEELKRLEWDPDKERLNVVKHGVDFRTAAMAFKDPHRRIFHDAHHSQNELRYFCFGKIGSRVLTVRFLYTQSGIRIIGAGFWRKGRKYYEEKRKI